MGATFISQMHTCLTCSKQQRFISVLFWAVLVLSWLNSLKPGGAYICRWTGFGFGTNFLGILIKMETFSLRKMHLKMSSAKWQPFCLGLCVLIDKISQEIPQQWHYCCVKTTSRSPRMYEYKGLHQSQWFNPYVTGLVTPYGNIELDRHWPR